METHLQSDGLLVHARPKWFELVQYAFIMVIASFMLTGLMLLGVSKVVPEFFDEPRPWLLIACMTIIFALGMAHYTYVNNRRRVYKLFRGRLEIGHRGQLTIALADIEKIRVGAPLTRFAQATAKANTALGVLSARNKAAADTLEAGFANVVVIDRAHDHTVIHVGTIANGHRLLEALFATVPEVFVESNYSDEERARLKGFRELSYAK